MRQSREEHTQQRGSSPAKLFGRKGRSRGKKTKNFKRRNLCFVAVEIDRNQGGERREKRDGMEEKNQKFILRVLKISWVEREIWKLRKNILQHSRRATIMSSKIHHNLYNFHSRENICNNLPKKQRPSVLFKWADRDASKLLRSAVISSKKLMCESLGCAISSLSEII